MPKHRRSKPKQCTGQRRDGRLCTAPAIASADYCFAHDPARVAERQAARQRGGRHRASVVRLRGLMPPRLVPIYELLESALGEVHEGSLKAGQAIAMATLARALVAVLQAGEMEERVRQLEQRAR